jgi:tryptophan 2,3-dioxygenase
MDLTYSSYLELDTLLSLQRPRTPGDEDELLFIIVHQTYELWFKQLLHEFERVRAGLFAGDLYGCIALFKRCRTIMKVLVEQVDIVETLTPMSFNSFRERLEQASGFQSSQFRELEFLLGYKRPMMLQFHTEGSPAYQRLTERLKEPSVYDAFFEFLRKQGAKLPEGTTDERRQEELLRLYKERHDLEILFELMTDFDEGFQEWRYRHIKLVERTIGSKRGTGGSLGVEFLKKSLFLHVFPDLWTIRHQL